MNVAKSKSPELTKYIFCIPTQVIKKSEPMKASWNLVRLPKNISVLVIIAIYATAPGSNTVRCETYPCHNEHKETSQ